MFPYSWLFCERLNAGLRHRHAVEVSQDLAYMPSGKDYLIAR